MPNLLLYLAFIGGEILHVLRMADLARQSTANGHTFWSYLSSCWLTIVVRGALGFALFSIWLTSPELFSLVGLNVPLAFPAYKAVALLAGYCADSGLDWVAQKFPWAGRQVPTASSIHTLADWPK